MVFTLSNGLQSTVEEMGLDRTCRSNVSPPRPTSLLLETNNNTLLADTTPVSVAANNAANVNNCQRRRKKKRASEFCVKRFCDLYTPTGETLGEGSQGSVQTYKKMSSNKEYAVKIIEKNQYKSRNKVLKEIEIFHHCRGHENILQLIEYFEEEDRFYVVFEKMEGGTLFETIERRRHLTEQEASLVIRDIATALHFLHQKGIAHRDMKPENILCTRPGHLTPVKICDFDLGSGVIVDSRHTTPVTTPELQTPVGSAEFMAPEVVDVWQDMAWSYDKKCDLWSLGIILYIMLCGYPPFYVDCGQDCGWNHGEPCQDCQDLLFAKIQGGVFDFVDDDWATISDEAKDLIRHLLVKDPHHRYSAAQVLSHPWVTNESPKTLLATPRVLQRNNSIKELQKFAENAMSVNRMILCHMSITEERESCQFFRDDEDLEDTFVDHEETIFHMDSSDNGSDNETDQAPILWMGLSPPGSSSLAQRRRRKSTLRCSSSDDDDQSSQSSVTTRFASAMF